MSEDSTKGKPMEQIIDILLKILEQKLHFFQVLFKAARLQIHA
jgi:hypothetical protein